MAKVKDKTMVGRVVKLRLPELESISISEMLMLLSELESHIWSPWAILLVYFCDDTEPRPPLTKYEDLFTSAGSGKMNMVDFFKEMSHGKVDISGTKVFDWIELPAKRADYIGNVPPQPGKLNRDGLRDLAVTTAIATGKNLEGFTDPNHPGYISVCVSGLGTVDLCGWLGGMAALCDETNLWPSLLGQEMGHGYGLDHSRLYGSTTDYQDRWDVMSTKTPFMAPHPEFTYVGPGMNAWNMRSRGWLDETRVWTAPSSSWDAVVQLRPLHRTDLSGFLAAQIGSYLVEFRVPQRWDAAIPRACIFVHSFSDNHSYLMPAYSGSQDIVEGDKFEFGDPNHPISGYYAAEVVNIDEANLTATVRLHQRPPQPVPVPGLIGQVSRGVQADGGGVIIVGDKVVKVPPRGPALELVKQVARYLDIDISTSDVEIALAARRNALETIVRAVVSLYSDAAATTEQPPGYLKNHQNSEKTK